MARRSTPRRARGRKRRGAGSTASAPATTGPAVSGDAVAKGGAAAANAPAQSSRREATRARREAERAATRFGDALTVGERPQPPWHPLPVAEILIFVGLVGIVVGVTRKAQGVPVIVAGVGAVVIGTLDFTIREHLSGYRSHASLLAAVPTAIFHSLVAVAMLAAGAPAPSWVVAPLLLDVPVFTFVFRRLRERFKVARHERILEAGR